MTKEKQQSLYLPGLNGIRTIASIAVVLSHITTSLKSFNLDPYILGSSLNGVPKTLDLAGFGVTIFFALSGFLITYLLWLEREISPININKFYMRRILRIWPLYYFYIGLSVIVLLGFSEVVNWGSMPFYIFFGANIPWILGESIPLISHYWSLGVEEQFYLFWPWVNKVKTNLIIKITVFIIILPVLIKSLLHFISPNSIIELAINETRIHCMLVGALAAMLYLKKVPWFNVVALHKVTQIIVGIIILLVVVNQYHLASFIDHEIISVVTALLIIGQITNTGIISLENWVFNFLGKISFGVYVYHPLIIFLIAKFLSRNDMNNQSYITIYVLILGITIFISYLSYIFIEMPFLKLKSNLYSVVKSRHSA